MTGTDQNNQWSAPILHELLDSVAVSETIRRAEVNKCLVGFKLAVRPEAVMRDCLRILMIDVIPAGNA